VDMLEGTLKSAKLSCDSDMAGLDHNLNYVIETK
jgi:hypothetical protein